MDKYFFCTCFDSNYLIKGIAMLESLERNCSNAHIYVLCLDKKTLSIITQLKLPFVTCVSLNDVENNELKAAKNNRSFMEYCWTLSSSFTYYVLDTYKHINLITYLDADLLFFSSIHPILKEIKNKSIAITEHRFSRPFEKLIVNGKYCVQWVSFRRDRQGITCLKKWKNQCLEWCYNKVEESRMGDQKYLDDWPNLYSKCHIIKNIGAGVAPWNYSQYTIKKNNKKITVNNNRLVFYHFHQFHLLNNGKFDWIPSSYITSSSFPDIIYEIYENSLNYSLNKIRKIDPIFKAGLRKNIGKLWLYRLFQNNTPVLIKKILRMIIRFRV